MKSSNKGEVAVAPKPGALATVDYGEFGGAGFEGQGREDYMLPFLGVLQAMSTKQLESIPGAKPGILFNTVTEELYKDGVKFVPCITQHVFVQWKKRDAGGGFVAVHQLDAEVVTKAKATQAFGEFEVERTEVDAKGRESKVMDDLIETFYVFGILVKADGTTEQACIAFTSTKIKVYKRWMTKARTIQIPGPNGTRITPPLFAHRFSLTTLKEKNTQGEFFNFNVSFDGVDAAACRLAPDDPVFQEAVGLRKMVQEGAAKADFSKQNVGGGGGAKGPAEEVM